MIRTAKFLFVSGIRSGWDERKKKKARLNLWCCFAWVCWIFLWMQWFVRIGLEYPKGDDMGYRNGSRSDLISEESTGLCEQLQPMRFQHCLPELQVLCLKPHWITGETMSVQGGALWREGKLKMEGHLYMIIYCKLIIQAILNKNTEFTQAFLHPQECRTGREHWITESISCYFGHHIARYLSQTWSLCQNSSWRRWLPQPPFLQMKQLFLGEVK